MKYDLMQQYQSYLGDNVGLRPETVRTYTNRLEVLLKGQSLIHTIENFDLSKILDHLERVKYKNEFSQSKNALLYFLEFQKIKLSHEQKKKIEEMKTKTTRKYRRLQSVNLEDIEKKIKYLRNKKLKFSYLTMLQTGLRVFELSQLTPNHCTVLETSMNFSFTGKGGKQEQVTLLKEENKKLFYSLKEMIEETEPNKKIFYSRLYLQQEAKKRGFQCHDLRRAFAKVEYKKAKSKEKVKQKLRHSSLKTTDIYVKSKVNIEP